MVKFVQNLDLYATFLELILQVCVLDQLFKGTQLFRGMLPLIFSVAMVKMPPKLFDSFH